MRRSACLLAMLGITVQSAAAENPFSTPPKAAPSARSMQFFSANASTPGADPAATPQRFTRSDVPRQDANEPGSELRNYYNELFGGLPENSGSAPVNPLAGKSAAPASQSTSPVVNAEYRPLSGTEQNVIQPVRAERFEARPFPSATAAPSQALPFPGSQPASPSLTQPIPVTEPTVPTALSAAAPPVAPARPSAASTLTTAPVATESTSASAPLVTLAWRKLSEINVGQECTCQLVVKNSGTANAHNVEVRAQFPTSVRLIKSSPEPTHSDTVLGWDLPELKAGEERVIEVVMIPQQRGEIATQADVRFSGIANGLFAVAEPLLDVRVEGPAQVLTGEPASHTVTITNPGTGVANHVEIEAVIPEGLEHARGNRLVMDLGALNPGESRSVRLPLVATKGGRRQLVVEARAESGLVRSATCEINVVAPSLVTTIDGPALRYVGRQGSFMLTVANDGAAATDNVRVMHKIPSGFEFVSSDRGAQYDPATGILNWFVGRLEREQKAQIKVQLTAKEIGEFKHFVRATSEHGSLSDVEMTSVVEGVSSLSMRVKDLEDPVEVGAETIYEVTIRNEGTAPARRVGLACELSPGMRLVSADGPVAHTGERGAVVFSGLPELGVGQSVVYQVKVASAAPGNLRFRAQLTSESVADPLITEELTRFYGE